MARNGGKSVKNLESEQKLNPLHSSIHCIFFLSPSVECINDYFWVSLIFSWFLVRYWTILLYRRSIQEILAQPNGFLSIVPTWTEQPRKLQPTWDEGSEFSGRSAPNSGAGGADTVADHRLRAHKAYMKWLQKHRVDSLGSNYDTTGKCSNTFLFSESWLAQWLLSFTE